MTPFASERKDMAWRLIGILMLFFLEKGKGRGAARGNRYFILVPPTEPAVAGLPRRCRFAFRLL